MRHMERLLDDEMSTLRQVLRHSFTRLRPCHRVLEGHWVLHLPGRRDRNLWTATRSENAMTQKHFHTVKDEAISSLNIRDKISDLFNLEIKSAESNVFRNGLYSRYYLEWVTGFWDHNQTK